MGSPWAPLGINLATTARGQFDYYFYEIILYTGFLTVQLKKLKNYKIRSRKIGTLIKNEKQKCDLQVAPTGLNGFNIEIHRFFEFFI